jgi:excisionase family DNA binding protein
MLKMKEVARELGVSYGFLLQRIKEGKLPKPVKIGRLYLYRPETLEAIKNGEFSA